MLGLNFFFVCFSELIEYRSAEGRLTLETLVAYANEYQIIGETREDLFHHMSGMNKAYNVHQAAVAEKERKAADRKAARKAKRGG